MGTKRTKRQTAAADFQLENPCKQALKPLYRKVNTRTRNVSHGTGGDYRHTRSSKSDSKVKQGAMGTKKRGLDYTPLLRFLLSNVGNNWDLVFSEAMARLDKQDPVFWIVALAPEDKKDYVRVGESSYYNGLYVDDDNRLQIVNPGVGPGTLAPFCGCCTHTFNGAPFTKKYRGLPKNQNPATPY